MDWTEERIRTLVSDVGVLRDGNALANPAKWAASVGRNDMAAWGLARGSGKEPYRVSVMLEDGSAKCTCPSRKFPCKHAVGLMFRLSATTIEIADPPDWVEERIANRNARQTKAAEEAEAAEAVETAGSTAKLPDAAARKKREAARERKVSAGVEELSRWMDDLIRMGIADARARQPSFWQHMAARMVDAQAAGLAKRLGRLEDTATTALPDWEAQLLDGLGLLHLLLTAYRRLSHLTEPLQHDVRTAIGWAIPTEQVLQGEGVRDQWHVLAVTHTQEERLIARRVWLHGEQTGRTALVLDFAPLLGQVGGKGGRFAREFVLGTCLHGELTFYPSAFPQRALVRTVERVVSRVDAPCGFGYADAEDVLNAYADAIAVQPWLEELPAGLATALLYPVGDEGEAALRTREGEKLPARIPCEPGFLSGLTGLHALPIFGTWNGSRFTARTVWAEGRYVALQPL